VVESSKYPYNLKGFPLLAVDPDAMAAVAVLQLRQLCAQPLPCATELIVPF
jgi:hypothetical protein